MLCHPDGALMAECCCVGVCPECVLCEGEQPSATVSVVGCDGGTCDDASGVYPWDFFAGNGDCAWWWGPHTVEYPPLTYAWDLSVFCTEGDWRIRIRLWDGFGFREMFMSNEKVACDEESGHLTGTYELAGMGACEGCTASVTFG